MTKAMMRRCLLLVLMGLGRADWALAFDPVNNQAICTPGAITWGPWLCPPADRGSVTMDPIIWDPTNGKACKTGYLKASTAAHPTNGYQVRVGTNGCGLIRTNTQVFTPTITNGYTYSISGPVPPIFTTNQVNSLSAIIDTTHTGAGLITFFLRWADPCSNIYEALSVQDTFGVYRVKFIKSDKYFACKEYVQQYDAKNNLTNDTYNLNNLSWTAADNINVSTSGIIFYSTNYGSHVISAASVDLPTCQDSFTLHLFKLFLTNSYLGVNLEDNPLPPHNSIRAWVDPGVAHYANWAIPSGTGCVVNPSNPGNVSSVSIEERGKASDGYLGDIVSVVVSPSPPNGDAGFTLTKNFTVVRVNLTVTDGITSLAETNEETVGANVPYNNDDDDASDKPDGSDEGEVAGEDDLVAVAVEIKPDNLPGSEIVTVTGTNIFLDAQKKTPALPTYPANAVPTMFYISGKEPSGNMLDCSLEVIHTNSGAKDKIKYTTFMVDLKGPALFENTAMDDHVEEYSANSWGRYVELNDDDDAPANGNNEWDFTDPLADRAQDARIKIMPLELKPGMSEGTGNELELTWSPELVAVYSGYSKTNLTRLTSGVIFRGPSAVPLLWIEGILASTAMKEVELTATYRRGVGPPSIDKMKLTVCSVDVDGDSNGDGVIDEFGDTDDKLEGSDQHPVYVLLNDDDGDANGAPDNANGTVDGPADLAQMANLAVRYVLPYDIPQGTVTLEGADNVRIFGEINGNWVEVKGPSAVGMDIWPYLPMNLKVEGVALGNEALTIRYKRGNTELTDLLYLKVFKVDLDLMWETANKANQIFNPTKKDDKSVDGYQEADSSNNTLYGIHREKLYVVPSDQNQYAVTLDLNIQPFSLRSQFVVAAYKNGTKVNGSDTPVPAQDNAQIDMIFTDPSSAAATTDFAIKAGLDANGNGTLDSGEMTIDLEVYKYPGNNQPRNATVFGINKAKYDWHHNEIAYYLNPTLLGISVDPGEPDYIAIYARSFLYMFMDGNDNGIRNDMKPTTTAQYQMDAFQQATANSSCFSEWLTHNSGAGFSDQGVANIPQRDWSKDTRVAQFFAQRSPLALENITIPPGGGYIESQTQTGAALEQFYDNQVKAAAEALLQNQPVDSTVTMPQSGGFYQFPNQNCNLFTSESFSWVPSATIRVGEGNAYGGKWGAFLSQYVGGTSSFDEYDAAGAIGRGRILSPRCRFTVQKVEKGIWPITWFEYPVTAVRFLGDIEDLYDFNYEDSELASHAAAHQIGYGNGNNGRSQGLIYRDKILIDYTYDYPFEQTVIPPPSP